MVSFLHFYCPRLPSCIFGDCPADEVVLEHIDTETDMPISEYFVNTLLDTPDNIHDMEVTGDPMITTDNATFVDDHADTHISDSETHLILIMTTMKKLYHTTLSPLFLH